MDWLYFFVIFLQIKKNYAIIFLNLFINNLFMTQATANKDEDLIILWEESSSTNDFNFDFLSSNETQSSSDILDFSSNWEMLTTQNHNQESKTESNFDFVFDFDQSTDISNQTTQDLSITSDEVWDFVFDSNSEISQNNTETISLDTTISNIVLDETIQEDNLVFDNITQLKEEVKESINITEDNSINLVSDEQEVAFIETKTEAIEDISPVVDIISQDAKDQAIGLIWDRNDILSETISRLDQRKEVISWIKSSKQSKITDLKSQIDLLKKQVSNLDTEVKDLEKEEVWIDADIATIEKMKSLSSETNDRSRKHKLDNIKNTK